MTDDDLCVCAHSLSAWHSSEGCHWCPLRYRGPVAAGQICACRRPRSAWDEMIRDTSAAPPTMDERDRWRSRAGRAVSKAGVWLGERIDGWF